MAVSFSTDNSALFDKEVDTPVINRDERSIISASTVDICKAWIRDSAYKRVALQYPDKYLHSAGEMVHSFEKDIEGLQVFVLADTSYGSCCVDEVAAEHSHSDCIVHVGHSCLSPTRRLPVMYVFGETSVDLTDCCEKFKKAFSSENAELPVNVALVYDVAVHHCIGAIHERLRTDFPSLVLSYFEVGSNSRICCNTTLPNSTSVDKELVNCVQSGGRTLYLPKDESLEDYTVLYIGSESMTLTNLMMTWNKCEFYRYDPVDKTARKEVVNVNKLLMKRYFLVEKARDARIVGILVGTLGVANYLQIIQKMKSLLKKAGKKYYTFVVGKLNVAKLANFMEIDIYVYVSCAENTLVDSKEFYRPIVTPHELEMACNPDLKWSGEYVSDFQQLLPGGRCYIPLPEGNIEACTDVSLITGEVRQIGVSDTEAPASLTQALMERGNNLQVANTAGEFLSHRSWRGLEPELGKTPVVKATKGRKGIAIGYENEPT